MAAVAELLHHVADFLEDDATSPAQNLSAGSPVAMDITEQMWNLRKVAVQLSEIAVEAEAEVAKEDGQ